MESLIFSTDNVVGGLLAMVRPVSRGWCQCVSTALNYKRPHQVLSAIKHVPATCDLTWDHNEAWDMGHVTIMKQILINPTFIPVSHSWSSFQSGSWAADDNDMTFISMVHLMSVIAPDILMHSSLN